MELGPLHTVGLAEARERARQARRLLLDDIDPIEHYAAERRKQESEAAKRVTFADAPRDIWTCTRRQIGSRVRGGWLTSAFANTCYRH